LFQANLNGKLVREIFAYTKSTVGFWTQRIEEKLFKKWMKRKEMLKIRGGRDND
jgi:hypothetical protein